MRRLTVSSLFPRGDLEEDDDEEESQLYVSLTAHRVCNNGQRPRGGVVSVAICQ